MFGNLVETFKTLYEMLQDFAASGVYLELDYASIAYSTIIMSAIFELVLFIFKGVGLFILSKRQNLKFAWLSFIPILSYIQMGRLVGNVRLWGTRTKHLGLFVSIALFANQLSSWIVDFSVWFDPFKQIVQNNQYDPTVYQYALNNAPPIMTFFSILSVIAGLAYVILYVFLIIAFFRYYEQKHPTLYALLSIFLELTGIFVFVVRNHDKINSFEEQRKYYENLYKEQYQNNGNAAPNSANQSAKEDDPFIEYSQKKTEDVFSEYSQQQPPQNNQNNGYSNYNSNNSPEGNNDSDEDLF